MLYQQEKRHGEVYLVVLERRRFYSWVIQEWEQYPLEELIFVSIDYYCRLDGRRKIYDYLPAMNDFIGSPSYWFKEV